MSKYLTIKLPLLVVTSFMLLLLGGVGYVTLNDIAGAASAAQGGDVSQAAPSSLKE